MAPYLVVMFFLLSLSSGGDGGKVLVYPVDGSHWINMKILLQALHSHGHQITVIRSSTSWYVSEVSPVYTSITITQEQPQNIESQEYMTSFLKRSMEIRRYRGSLWAFFEFYRNTFELFEGNQRTVANVASCMLENKTLMRELKDSGFDMLLTDPAFPAGVLIGHALNLPLVFNVRWVYIGEAHFAIAPSPLSYIPVVFSFNPEKMTFFQRVVNVISQAMLLYMYYYIADPPYQVLCERHFGANVTTLSLIQGADLWLMRVDFSFEFPRPTMPNVVYIGGFQGKPSKELPPDLEAFVQSSGEHGVIIMTLGTLLSDPGPELSETFASAFASLPQKIIWRHLGKKPLSLGNNTMLTDWLPQNDLLGHPKTRLFVTHGGTNGLYEAIYHAVPVLGIPLIFDQDDNMVRMKARGVAETVEVTNMDVVSLTNALKNILDPEKPYKQNMMELSQLHHDKPVKPIDSAIFWMEFVMRHRGAAHLRTESYKLPWYAYYNVDVLAVLTLSAASVIGLVWASCKCLLRSFTGTQKSKIE